jgi:hypothetical protein
MTDSPSFGLQYMHGSHRGPNPPAFCRGCARPMRITSEPRRYDRFDPETGAEQFERHARCPRQWWDRFLHPGTFHDHAVEDEHGDWPWL